MPRIRFQPGREVVLSEEVWVIVGPEGEFYTRIRRLEDGEERVVSSMGVKVGLEETRRLTNQRRAAKLRRRSTR